MLGLKWFPEMNRFNAYKIHFYQTSNNTPGQNIMDPLQMYIHLCQTSEYWISSVQNLLYLKLSHHIIFPLLKKQNKHPFLGSCLTWGKIHGWVQTSSQAAAPKNPPQKTGRRWKVVTVHFVDPNHGIPRFGEGRERREGVWFSGLIRMEGGWMWIDCFLYSGEFLGSFFLGGWGFWCWYILFLFVACVFGCLVSPPKYHTSVLQSRVWCRPFSTP